MEPSSTHHSAVPWVRPNFIRDAPEHVVLRQRDTSLVVNWLRNGQSVWLQGHFGLGVRLLDALELSHGSMEDLTHAARRVQMQIRRKEASRLLVRILNHQVDIPGAPEIGFLKELYPNQDSFFLPLLDIQALYGAWKTYEDGVSFPVLGHRLHPFWGTYLPHRMTHLELFGTWLSQFKGARQIGIDVGVGCGVLAFMMCRAGFKQVIGTDCNQNAVESVSRQQKKVGYPTPLELVHTDLLTNVTATADLIVFNPPWVPGKPADTIQQALMYQDGLFKRFFDQAFGRLAPEGRVVLVFSNVLRLVRPDAPHPIEQELKRNRFELVQKLQRKVKGKKDADGRSRRTRERVEIWELQRAAKK